MLVRIYGLKNCDTCRKAVKELEEAGRDHEFVDIRDELDRVRKVPAWIDAVGAKKLVNTRSTTWRNLSAEDKLIAEDDPAGLLITYPTLIKRPVIEAGGDVIVGWSGDTLAGLTAPE